MAYLEGGRALVLGGGGVAGVAWEAGMLAGLGDAGVDLAAADLIVGTSAGSIVGSLVGLGVDLTETIEGFAAATAAETGAAPPALEVDMDAVLTAFGILFDPGIDPRQARMQVAKLALEARVDGSGERLEAVGHQLSGRDWPRQLLVTAVDTADGAFVVWDRDSGVPLSKAVMASCCVPCVFPPVEVGGRRYMDGGSRSVTNADLARGAARVVILEPMAHFFPRTALEREVRELGDARVAAVGADEAAVEVFGVNVLDQTLWKPAFQAGRTQSAAAAAEIGAVWNA